MSTLDPKTLVCGLIAWMRAEGVAPTRTRLMKFLYLADLQFARHHEGRTVTNWRWYVNAFGPLADEAYRLFERGVEDGWLSVNEQSRPDESDAKTLFYRQNENVPADTLVAIGKVREWIKRFGDDTPRLLRYVYGATEPMEGAREGDTLDFSRAHPIDVRPLKGRAPTRDEKRRFAELSAQLKARYETIGKANAAVPEGPRDEAFLRDLPVDNQQMAGDVVLIFSKER